jgi:hypothetical protein
MGTSCLPYPEEIFVFDDFEKEELFLKNTV